MVKTLRHGGKMGDVIYSLPAIRELGGGVLYLPENTPDQVSGMFTSMKSLLRLQPFIKGVVEYPSGLVYGERAAGMHIDYDLDKARLQPAKGVIHIVKRYLDTFGIKLPSWKEPWLTVDDLPAPVKGEYTVFNYTGRHVVNDLLPSPPFDWRKLYFNVPGRKVFVGTPEEAGYFYSLTGCEEWIKTDNALQLARVVRDAKAIYCNQSLVLTLAQGLGKTYYLFPKPFKTNCIMNTPNENILK